VSGGWGQNIGNAFFNLGGRHLLEAAGAHVSFIQDSPAYWTFYDQSQGDRKNAYAIVEALEFDLLVLQGPLFTTAFSAIWRDRLKRLADRGVMWAVQSGAFRKYVPDELDVAVSVMADVPPAFVCTRDDESARLLRSRGIDVVQGIDSAFFVPEAVPALRRRRDTEPFVTFVFDHFSEPTLTPSPSGVVAIGDERFALQQHGATSWAARRGKAQSYLSLPFDRRRYPRRVAGRLIVRPEHRTNPHIPFKIYRHPNGLASDEPWTYLHAYATTELTIGDRVHACIATLAYGNPAMLWNPTTKRSALFASIRAERITEAVVYPDMEYLATRKRGMLEEIRERLQSV
jgi:hypothetical protein